MLTGRGAAATVSDATCWGDDSGQGATSVAKALQLLALTATSEGGVASLSRLAASAEMPKSTTHRLLKELERHQFIDREGSKYRIGNRFLEMSQLALWSEHAALQEIAAPSLERLFESTGATVHLAVLDQLDVLYIEKITGAGGCRIPSRVGMRVPATCTALGKAMLAFGSVDVLKSVLTRPLPRMTPYSVTDVTVLMHQIKAIRDSGVAYDFEESRLTVRCVAAPVVTPHGSLAAVSVGAASSQFDPSRYVQVVLQAARDITRDLRRSAQPAA